MEDPKIAFISKDLFEDHGAEIIKKQTAAMREKAGWIDKPVLTCRTITPDGLWHVIFMMLIDPEHPDMIVERDGETEGVFMKTAEDRTIFPTPFLMGTCQERIWRELLAELEGKE